MSNESENRASPPGLGKKITTLGVAMFTTSIVLAMVGVSGALFHNTLQIGGIAIAVVGLILWKVLKK